MKKNRLMKAAAFLCVMTLMTSCFVGGTFAKYVTSESGSDKARVAKFGVEITANGSMFEKAYATDDNRGIYTEAYSVVSQNDDKLLAPGTKGDMVSMTLSGIPEVAVLVTYDADVDLGENWKVGEEEYCPLIVTVKNGAEGAQTVINGLACKSVSEFETKIMNAIESYGKVYPYNTDLSGKNADSLDITWEWPFESGYDEKDTALGDAAAKDPNNAAKIEIKVTTTVTQID